MKLLQIRSFALFRSITKSPDITETEIVILKLDSKIQGQFGQVESCSFFHKHPSDFFKRQTSWFEMRENEAETPETN